MGDQSPDPDLMGAIRYHTRSLGIRIEDADVAVIAATDRLLGPMRDKLVQRDLSDVKIELVPDYGKGPDA